MTTWRPRLSILVLVALAYLSTASLLSAQTSQPSQGAIVSGTIGAFAMDSETALSFSVGTAYRFNRSFGLGIEFTSAPSVESEGFSIATIFPPTRFPERESQVTAFTANVRLEVPTISARFIPYAIAGGGVANIKEDVDAILAYSTTLTTLSTTFPTRLPPDFPVIYPPIPYSYRLSTTSLALTLGGGVSVMAGAHLSIDVDLRYLRLLDTRNRNIGRFGAGASYRF